jgi:acyl-coenzyme A synthetase/AMP-(fatty) acid ligase
MNDGHPFWCSGNDFITHQKYNDWCAEVLNEESRILVNSSGTTRGSLKRVIYDSERFLAGMQKVAENLELSSGRQAVSFVNPRFIYGLSVAVSHCIAEEGVAFITKDNCKIEDISLAGKTFLDIYMTPAQAIPFCLKNIIFPDKITVRFIFAGDKLPQTVANRLSTQYPKSLLTNMYGQVELGPRVSVNHTESASFMEGDVGFPLNGVDIAIAETSKSKTGVLKVRSDYQMLGYLSQNTFVPNDVLHWTETGDNARIDETGRLFITGRSSKHVNIAGIRID